MAVPQEQVTEEEVQEDGSEVEEGKEVEPTGSEPAGKEGSDEGGEDSEDGEDTGENEVTEEPVEDPEKSELLAKIAELESKITAPKEPEYREPSPEEQAAWPETHGMEYRAWQAMNGQLSGLGTALKGYVDELFSGLSVGNAIKSMASNKEFADVSKYESGMTEFLKKEVAPSKRSDPKMLAMAYYHEKGRQASGAVKQAVASKERHKKMGTVNRPSSPSSKPAGAQKQATKLTPIQRSAARAFGLSEDEYAEQKFGKKK